MAILWVTKRGVEDFQKQIQKLLAAIPFDALFFNHHFGRVLEGFVSAILLGQNVVGHYFSVSFFFWLFFHVYLAALILSIQWCFRILQKHGSMTPSMVVFPCVSVHVKIMSLLLLLVADGSCKSRSLYTTIITLKSFRRALTAPPAINLLSLRLICRFCIQVCIRLKDVHMFLISSHLAKSLIPNKRISQINSKHIHGALTDDMPCLIQWIIITQVAKCEAQKPNKFPPKTAPLFWDMQTCLEPKRSKRSTSEILPCQHNWNRMH